MIGDENVLHLIEGVELNQSGYEAALYRAALQPVNLHNWHSDRGFPGVEGFIGAVDERLLTHYVVLDGADEAVGVVLFQDYQPKNGVIELKAIGLRGSSYFEVPEDLIDEAVRRTVQNYPIRKVLRSVPGFVERSGMRCWRHECSIESRDFFAGKYWNRDIVSWDSKSAGPVVDSGRTTSDEVGEEFLVTQHLTLDGVTRFDTDFLREVLMGSDTGFRWRLRGARVGSKNFGRALWSDVFVQFVVRLRRGGQAIGHVVAYGSELRSGVVHIGGAMLPKWERSGLGVEAIHGLGKYLVAGWPFRSLLGEVPEFNLPFLNSMDDRSLIVGAVSDYLYHDGRYWNEYLVSIRRSDVARAGEIN